MIDNDGDLPVRVATEEERRVALFRSIARYPELVPLLPSRPPEAITCSSCGGAGVHLERFANPLLRHLIVRVAALVGLLTKWERAKWLLGRKRLSKTTFASLCARTASFVTCPSTMSGALPFPAADRLGP